MGWHARLDLRLRLQGERTVCFDRHEGPLRVLASLYPESPSVCHQVLVHPPAGVVGGDVLHLEAALEGGTHALLTTAGATRFYRSAGAAAEQTLRARLGAAARLEWLPFETIAYSGTIAANRLRFELDADAEMIGWDLLALGLPAAQLPFVSGRFAQEIELPGCWLERGSVHADDCLLLDSPLGFAGQRVLATLWFASGSPLEPARRAVLLDAARDAAAASSLAPRAGVSAPQREVVVLRALAAQVEPAMALLREVWSRWRAAAWQLAPCAPRIWKM